MNLMLLFNFLARNDLDFFFTLTVRFSILYYKSNCLRHIKIYILKIYLVNIKFTNSIKPIFCTI